MTNWQSGQPPSWQNDAARRAQDQAEQARRMTEQAIRNSQQASQYRMASRRAGRRRRHPFIRFVVTIAVLAAVAYVGYRVLSASGSVHIHF